MPRPQSVALVGVCPRCGESIELLISKKQAKLIVRGFKMDIHQAQLQADDTLALDYEKLKVLVK